MSGTYQLSTPGGGVNTLALFPEQPLTKRWQRQQIAIGGESESLYSAFWQLELGFGTLKVSDEASFFMSRFVSGGLFYATLPHPVVPLQVTFSGVNIADFSYEFGDTDSDSWALNPRLTLDVNISATGTF